MKAEGEEEEEEEGEEGEDVATPASVHGGFHGSDMNGVAMPSFVLLLLLLLLLPERRLRRAERGAAASFADDRSGRFTGARVEENDEQLCASIDVAPMAKQIERPEGGIVVSGIKNVPNSVSLTRFVGQSWQNQINKSGLSSQL